jgi:TetR/AcrR family transcriptional regulator, mexJK operon transcriptional repressor
LDRRGDPVGSFVGEEKRIPERRVPGASKRKPSRRKYPRKTAEILAAAEELFLKKGYGNTSMDAVASLAKVTKATVYANFADKATLFDAVVRRRHARGGPTLDHIDLKTGNLKSGLIELGNAFLLDIYSRNHVELFQTIVADSRRFPELGKLMIAGPFAETHEKIVKFFQDRTAAGEMRSIAGSTGAGHFIALLKVDAHVRLVFSQPIDVSPKAIRKIAEGVVDLFLNGALPPRRR